MDESPVTSPVEKGGFKYQQLFDIAADGLVVSDLDTGEVLLANDAACQMHGYGDLTGAQLMALLHPDSRQTFSEALRRGPAGGVICVGTRDIQRDGSNFFAEWRGTLFSWEGRQCILSVVRDVTERMEAERVVLRQMASSALEQTALMEISQMLVSKLEFEPKWILTKLREVIEFAAGAFCELRGFVLVPLATLSAGPSVPAPMFRIDLRRQEAVDTLFNDHRPIIIEDVRADTPETRLLQATLTDDLALLPEGTRSLMWVPVAVKGRVLGGYALAHPRRDFFTTHHGDLALKVANQVAMAMINAELYRNAQSAAATEERQRLAQSLHDAINQSLFSAGLIAEVLPRVWDQDQSTARQSLEDLRRLLRGAAAEMRALLAELRPSTLTDAQLGELLHLQGNAFTGRTNIPAKVTVVGRGTLPPDVQLTIYRICQEAVANIAKHAEASDVEISLRHMRRGVELSICDNGRGFDPTTVTSDHYGLNMMRERAERIGAALSIKSQPGQGTQITIRWPRASV